jgi:hypothetical protein
VDIEFVIVAVRKTGHRVRVACWSRFAGLLLCWFAALLVACWSRFAGLLLCWLLAGCLLVACWLLAGCLLVACLIKIRALNQFFCGLILNRTYSYSYSFISFIFSNVIL